MRTPRIRVELNKGSHGVQLDKLASIARDTAKFLVSLSVDLGDPETEWVAENFKNGSLEFDITKHRESSVDVGLWKEALSSVMSNRYSNEVLNLRIRLETRLRYGAIANGIGEGEKVTFGILDGDESGIEWHTLDKDAASSIDVAAPTSGQYYGEIQGIVHALYKETKRPKLVIRELSTRNLVDCYFSEEMYAHAVALLEDKDAVVFVEGAVSENSSGEITDIFVRDFTPAPDFDANVMEHFIGRFPNVLTGGEDAASLLDDFRNG
jgi:hypothetical protein